MCRTPLSISATHALDFLLDLIRSHEDMRIILRKAAHTHQPVQRAGELMAVHQPQFAHPQGRSR